MKTRPTTTASAKPEPSDDDSVSVRHPRRHPRRHPEAPYIVTTGGGMADPEGGGIWGEFGKAFIDLSQRDWHQG